MKRLSAAFVLLFFALPLFAADPLVISGQSRVDPYKLVELQATGDVNGKALIWDVSPEDKADIRELPGGKLLFTAPPGTYRVKLRVISLKDGISTVESARTTVTIGDTNPPAPNPVPPTPGPSPTPTPPPLKMAYILVVEETSDASAARGPFITDKDLTAYVKSKGWAVKVVDKDVLDPNTNKTPASLQPWFDKIKDKNGGWTNLPQILVIDQDGNIRHQDKVPKTPADLLTILKKIGG